MTGRSFSPTEVSSIRRTRRHPRPTQFDYLHLRRLLRDIRAAMAAIEDPVHEVLDVYCGSRPYDDLLPRGARCVGLDTTASPYGVADVLSDEFLPFEDASFDLVTCYEAFHYVADPVKGVAELLRVLRPGGSVLLTVPLVWEYDRTILEHRFTGPELAALFAGWDSVEVRENGGRAVVWATVTGTILQRGHARLAALPVAGRAASVVFPLAYVGLNLIGAALEAAEERTTEGALTLPMNLLLSARRPASD